MLWLTSTLSTLSRLISKVRRLMKPVLWTTRRLVTSVSVVQRWNQAVSILYSAKTAAIAASARQSSIGVLGDEHAATATRKASATIQAPIAGR